jgi:hypothetical protein
LWKHITSECIHNCFFLNFLYLKICFQIMGTFPSGAELDLQIICHSCQWHECLMHKFLHTYVIFKTESNTSCHLICVNSLTDQQFMLSYGPHCSIFSTIFLHCPICMFMHLRQCLKNRPIYRLIVNRWVSNKIITYWSDLSPWPIYQSDSQYFDQNILNFATYGYLIDDSSVRETIFGPLVMYFLCSHLIHAFCCCPSSLVVSIKTKRRE